MATFWNFVLTCIKSSPWIVIALVLCWLWLKRKDSKLLLLQAAGAGGMFWLPIAEWILLRLLSWMNAGPGIVGGMGAIFSFLLFLCLAAFATGYCIERFYNRKTITVSATPVQ